LFGLKLQSSCIEKIIQNGETLRSLSLGPMLLDHELIQKLFTKCHQLTEVNMYNFHSGGSRKQDSNAQICALVKNLTPNILKLSFSSYKVKGEHVATLVQRCKKITELDLFHTDSDSVKRIVENLNFLEKLNLVITNDGGYQGFVYQTLLQLKSITTLKVLHCNVFPEEIENLKLQLPHISINEGSALHHQIARPEKGVRRSIDEDWFWEKRANQQDLFPSVDDIENKKNIVQKHF